MDHRDFGARNLGRGGAAHLPDTFLQRIHAVHAGMHIAEAAAIGVHRQLATGPSVAVGDERTRLAPADEAEILESVDRQMRERVIDHQMINVRVTDPGGFKCLLAGNLKCRRGGEIGHLADHRRFCALAGTADIDRLLRHVLSAIRFGQDQRPATISHQTTHQQPERIADHLRVQHIVDGDRVLKTGTRVLAGPFSLHHRDHGQGFLAQIKVLHVAQHRNGEHGRGTGNAKGSLELLLKQRRKDRRAMASQARPTALAMGDQHGVTESFVDRRGGMANQQHERTTANRSAVEPFWHDAQVMRDLDGVMTAGGDPVDVRELQARIRERV